MNHRTFKTFVNQVKKAARDGGLFYRPYSPLELAYWRLSPPPTNAYSLQLSLDSIAQHREQSVTDVLNDRSFIEKTGLDQKNFDRLIAAGKSNTPAPPAQITCIPS